MTYINAGVQLEVVNCWSCGCMFALSADLKNNMMSREETLYCPKGCRLSLGEPHWKKKLERALKSEEYYKESAARNREHAQKTERKLTATRGVVTRFKNRISRGVCPCCDLSFADLERHMKTKHPDYATSTDCVN